ncbi:MAG: hypothetical protein M3396_06345 [Actinomycetota bacterium]|nr:hypothetical protein [Actinomycetota bacterium]MDQ3573588.1 hypothetical protein [Actinomycetota bacterium]
MGPEGNDFDPETRDPLVSAVVAVREDAPSDGSAVDNPVDVISEAAAMLAGVNLEVDVASAPSGAESSSEGEPGQANAIARAKGYFEKAGFEVHAPIAMTFSIAATKSFFEEFFGQGLLVDEERFFAPVTTTEGGDQLPTDGLPDDIRDLVQAVFLPPPELPEGLSFEDDRG